MIRRLAMLSLLLAGNAWSQQSMDISEKDLGTSAAQSRLSALARQAEITGGRVVVTAPQHLHAQIAAALRAGGSSEVVLKDGFYENVLVRIEEKAEEAPQPEVRPAAPAPRSAPAPVRAAPAANPAPVAAPAQPQRAPEPAPAPEVEATPPPLPPVVDDAMATPPSSEPVAAPSVEEAGSAAADVSPSNVFVASEPGDVVPARASLEQLYNEGKRISETITPARLRRGDLIYLGDGAAVVVRRDTRLLLRFWLEGSIELKQSAIINESGNKYRVVGESIR
ncbi:MAG: hypothetical protein ABI650_07310 [Dokdonella sp.]